MPVNTYVQSPVHGTAECFTLHCTSTTKQVMTSTANLPPCPIAGAPVQRLNAVIQEPLSLCSESYIAMAVNIFREVVVLNV